MFFSNFASVFNTCKSKHVKILYSLLIMTMLLCVSCDWQLKPGTTNSTDAEVVIERYDRIESLYLTTGEYSALQQMNTNYPMQTRMLIEDMLTLGKVNDPDINTKFLRFFQDSTLQAMLADVQQQYADVSDLTADLTAAFARLQEELPELEIPQVYTQVGSFDESVIVGNGTLGISLDKYLGADYPFYQTHYSAEQRRLMVRSMIVPDCVAFYLISVYPLTHEQQLSPLERERHMGRIQWVVNKVMGRPVFSSQYVAYADRMMKHDKSLTVEQLLRQEKR